MRDPSSQLSRKGIPANSLGLWRIDDLSRISYRWHTLGPIVVGLWRLLADGPGLTYHLVCELRFAHVWIPKLRNARSKPQSLVGCFDRLRRRLAQQSPCPSTLGPTWTSLVGIRYDLYGHSRPRNFIRDWRKTSSTSKAWKRKSGPTTWLLKISRPIETSTKKESMR